MGENYNHNIAIVSFSALADLVLYVHILKDPDVAVLGIIGIVISMVGIVSMLSWAEKSHQIFDSMVDYKERFLFHAGLLSVESPRDKREVTSLKDLPKTLRGGKAGYVYVIQEKSQGHYKIGRTIDPSSRMKTFGLKLPFKIEYLYMIEAFDMYKLESQLHKRFARKHVNGEWFNLSQSDLLWIEDNCNPVYVNTKES